MSILLSDIEAATTAGQPTKEPLQQEQRLLGSSNHNHNSHHIAYCNFVHSIKSHMTRRVYIRLLWAYMNWISIADDDYDTMLQKDSLALNTKIRKIR
jgi:hypothetical protein